MGAVTMIPGKATFLARDNSREGNKNTGHSWCLAGGIWTCTIDSLPLMPELYTLDLQCGSFAQVFDYIPDAATFGVVEGNFFGTGRFPKIKQKYGPFFVRQRWTTHRVEAR